MSSKKDETEGQQKEGATSQDSMPQDWHPDHFPTSAKPIFFKVSTLFIGILILCLFLAYCSESENSHKKDGTNSINKNGNLDNEPDQDDTDIFE